MNIVKSNHIAWDAGLGTKLDAVRLDVREHANHLNASIKSVVSQYGFVLLKGLGEDGNKDEIKNRLLTLSDQLGTILPQSPRNEMIEDVRDFSDVDERDDRGYRSKGELTPHSDPPSLIALHCLKPAKSGGESYLVNVQSVHDAMAASHPDLLKVLYQGYRHWRVEGQIGGPGPSSVLRPVLTQYQDRVSCVYYRPFAEKGAAAAGEPLNTEQIAAMDVFDHYSNSPEFALRFHLATDETLIAHNRFVLHARTDYEDWDDPAERRHLLRVWIDAPDLLPVSPAHQLGDIFATE